jgi:hypothetical protein
LAASTRPHLATLCVPGKALDRLRFLVGSDSFIQSGASSSERTNFVIFAFFALFVVKNYVLEHFK